MDVSSGGVGRSLVTPLTIVALVVALGSSAYASHLVVRASDIAKGAVRTKHIKAQAVRTKKLKDGAVTVTKLADGAVTGPKIATGAVSSTDLSNNAVTLQKIATNAVTTRAFGTIVHREEEFDIPDGGTLIGTVDCLEGEIAVAGGVRWTSLSFADGGFILMSEAAGHLNFFGALVNPTAWSGGVRNETGLDRSFTVSVECLVP